MNFIYTMTKEDVKKYLAKNQCKTNIRYLILFTVFYFMICYSFLFEKTGVVLLSYIFYLVLMYFLLYVIHLLYIFIVMKAYEKLPYSIYGNYEIFLDKKELIQRHEGQSQKLAYDQIRKIKQGKDDFLVIGKGFKQSYYLRQSYFQDEKEFQTLKEQLLKKYEKVIDKK